MCHHTSKTATKKCRRFRAVSLEFWDSYKLTGQPFTCAQVDKECETKCDQCNRKACKCKHVVAVDSETPCEKRVYSCKCTCPNGCGKIPHGCQCYKLAQPADSGSESSSSESSDSSSDSDSSVSELDDSPAPTMERMVSADTTQQFQAMLLANNRRAAGKKS